MLAIAATERVLADDEIIVSKTNLQGHLTYANDAFLSIADFALGEVMGKPQNVVRNPAMPRAIYRLLWARLEAGREIFAYVVSRTKHGDHYRVFRARQPQGGARSLLCVSRELPEEKGNGL